MIKITDYTYAKHIGNITLSEEKTQNSNNVFDYPLSMIYNEDFKRKHDHLSIVYFMVIDGEIKKIGHTNTKSGIDGCLNFYLNAGMDNPGECRFVISYLIREQLKLGKNVEIWIQFSEKKLNYTIPGKDKLEIISDLPPSKEIERVCLFEYYNKEETYPDWNFQELKKPYPIHLQEKFADYKLKRVNRIKC